MKIAIIGNAGSGKSTLALQLHQTLRVPLYHLDQYFWKPGWQEPDRQKFEKIHNALCDQDRWIIEGMAIRFLDYRIQKADVVIFLDMPTYLCLFRVCKRAFTHFGTVYFSSAAGCPERGPDMKFFKFIIGFNRDRRPVIEELLRMHHEKKSIFVVRNQSELSKITPQMSQRK